MTSKNAFNLRRTLAIGAFGLLWSGPSAHYWQAWLQKRFPKQDDASVVQKAKSLPICCLFCNYSNSICIKSEMCISCPCLVFLCRSSSTKSHTVSQISLRSSPVCSHLLCSRCQHFYTCAQTDLEIGSFAGPVCNLALMSFLALIVDGRSLKFTWNKLRSDFW